MRFISARQAYALGASVPAPRAPMAPTASRTLLAPQPALAPSTDPCAGVLCPPGLSCRGGVCIDVLCAGVLCPGGGTCSQGLCSTPAPTQTAQQPAQIQPAPQPASPLPPSPLPQESQPAPVPQVISAGQASRLMPQLAPPPPPAFVFQPPASPPPQAPQLSPAPQLAPMRTLPPAPAPVIPRYVYTPVAPAPADAQHDSLSPHDASAGSVSAASSLPLLGLAIVALLFFK